MTSKTLFLAVALSAALAAAHEASAAAPDSAAAGAKAGATARARAGGPRTLDEVHIEGEIPVPQMLFITARDQRRFIESKHRRYLRTSLEIARSTSLPSHIQLTRAPLAGAHTEP